ncbi:MAG: Histidine triad (HIT) family hydrolase [Candidatus Woesebacteria bacterium GW2011_GWA1_39_21]|uniref:Histidine triad (HIT) family hydrolase n=1 Tax=Candidatus Woesebacteria bacterium GW2011_GWA1_39_21 TaxID=1618550 RepID=A0A0G0N2T2_9BACT|nr:MAG: Histidine triad (HIT) family hydrolase [Candidatus Woesebacteria bacterium GW2011_GWA1_39_21]
MDKNCVFCKIVKGKIPCHKVWEDEKHIAFLSIFPNTEGFTVVATKKHLPSYPFENSDKVLTDLVIASKKTAKVLDNYFTDVGRCGMFFEGFGVDHIHSKLFPMHGTADMAKWKPIESNMPEVYFDKYPGYLSSHNSKRANDEKLSKLAEKIRKSVTRKK